MPAAIMLALLLRLTESPRRESFAAVSMTLVACSSGSAHAVTTLRRTARDDAVSSSGEDGEQYGPARPAGSLGAPGSDTRLRQCNIHSAQRHQDDRILIANHLDGQGDSRVGCTASLGPSYLLAHLVGPQPHPVLARIRTRGNRLVEHHHGRGFR